MLNNTLIKEFDFYSKSCLLTPFSSDKNKRNNVRKTAKLTKSSTTSYSNNAIQNSRQLSCVDNHNYKKDDNKQDNIYIVRGTTSLLEDVKNLYKEEVEESLKEFNVKQTSDDKKMKELSITLNNVDDELNNNRKN